jgi:hypothetical protein
LEDKKLKKWVKVRAVPLVELLEAKEGKMAIRRYEIAHLAGNSILVRLSRSVLEEPFFFLLCTICVALQKNCSDPCLTHFMSL